MACTLDKMLIKGIRSFSPDNQAVIEFYKPLTLIVGHNGAGKTTIIECLKMACTGELPPNTRSGQSFIHDPKIAGETEVKAQIKLRFITGAGQPVVVIRSFQLTQRKSSMAFKALDNVLQTVNRATGAREALSYRCADIDRILPTLMGVSAAVLESVVFVHQEDSNWPLADAATVKRRFDDIFAATKYTKALEALRKLKTDKAAEVREMRLRLETLRTLRQSATRLRDAAEAGETARAAHETRIAELEARSDAIQRELEQVEAQLAVVEELELKRKQLQAQHSVLAEQNATVHARLVSAYGEEDVGIPQEELEEWNASLAPQTQVTGADVARLQREISRASLEGDAAREQISQELRRQAQLVAAQEALTGSVRERDRLLEEIVTYLDAPSNADSFYVPQRTAEKTAWSAEHVSETTGAFQRFLQHLSAHLEELREEHTVHDAEIGARAEALGASLAAGAEQARQGEARLARIADARRVAVEERNRLAGSLAAVESAAQREQQARAALEAAEAAHVSERIDGRLQETVAELARIASDLTSLRAERDTLSAAGEAATRLRLKRTELADKKAEMQGLLDRVRTIEEEDTFEVKVCARDRPDSVLQAVQRLVARRSSAMESARQDVEGCKARCATLAGQLERLREEERVANCELESLDSVLTAGLAKWMSTQHHQVDADNVAGAHHHHHHTSLPTKSTNSSSTPALEMATKECEAARAERARKLETADAFAAMTDRFLSAATERNLCHTCGRPFANVQERDAFVSRQRAERDRLPGARRAWEAGLRETEATLAALRALGPQAARHDVVCNETLPKLQGQIAEIEQAWSTEEERLAGCQHAMETASARQAAARTLLESMAWPLDKLVREIASLESEIQVVSTSQGYSNTNRTHQKTTADQSLKTVRSLDSEIAAREEARAVQEALREELLRRQGRQRDERTALVAELSSAREEALARKSAAQRAADLTAREHELEAEEAAVREEIQQAYAGREPLLNEQRQLAEARTRARNAAQQALAASSQRLRDAQLMASRLETCMAAVSRGEAQGAEEALHRVERALSELSARQAAAEGEARRLADELASVEAAAAEQESLRHQIGDLLAYRRALAQETGLAEALDAVNREVVDAGDVSALASRCDTLRAELSKLRSKQDQSVGAIRTIQDTVRQARAELGQEQYHEVDVRYRTQLIQLKTTELANTDLERYHKALEKALLSFHTTKMLDINRAIKELWQQTYRAADIDYIQVRADAEGAAGRSYNYRVVMICNGAELDMRGRCSAGQKILACLIIRLALAETFCLKCGVLALDEPTTNLDAENSASLAEALRQIILSRQGQDTFQLIVITHDETFAKLIGVREYAEYMWRVTKDEHQKTLVLQEEIAT